MRRIKDVAESLGISPESIRKWEREGLINLGRTPLGHRIFKPEDVRTIEKIVQQKISQRNGN